MSRHSIDLHGKTVSEVEPLIDQFLHQSQQNQLSRVRIVTGKGTGKVKNAVIRYLKMGRYPWSYEKTKSGTNEGVLIVHLD